MKYLTSENTTGMADNTYNTLRYSHLTAMVTILKKKFEIACFNVNLNKASNSCKTNTSVAFFFQSQCKTVNR